MCWRFTILTSAWHYMKMNCNIILYQMWRQHISAEETATTVKCHDALQNATKWSKAWQNLSELYVFDWNVIGPEISCWGISFSVNQDDRWFCDQIKF